MADFRKLGKGVTGALAQAKQLAAAEREANLQKMLEPSAVKMRLYHGTTATEGGKGQEAIRRIKPSKEGALGSGVYMTPNTAHASGYTGIPNDEALESMRGSQYYSKMADQFMADRAAGTLREGQEGGNMLPVYAQIKNPLIIGKSGRNIDPAAEALINLGMDEESAIKLVEKAFEEKGNIGKQIQSRAQAQGYDGIMQYRGDDLSEVVSYNPNAVKSATGNQGTYDIYSPDLSKADGGKIVKGVTGALKKATEMAKAVDAEAAGVKALTAAEREANLAKFLEQSQVKDRLYRGQRKVPKPDKFVTTQSRATPSFTDNPEVANVYSQQLGWDIAHGPGSTSVPVYVQMNKPFDVRDLGEHITLEEFLSKLDHDLSVPRGTDKIGYEDLADILGTLDHHVFKGNAKHNIDATDKRGTFRVRNFEQLADEVSEAGKNKNIDRILDELLFDSSVDTYALADSPEVVKQLKKLGYDSMIHKDVFDAGMPYYKGDPKKIGEGFDADHTIDAYRPFEQTKIKSSIGNRGTYDINDPDITKADGGGVKHMADAGRVTKVVTGALNKAKELAQAKKASESKIAEMLEAQQAPMTRPQGTGLPLMPRDQGMYTPREQKDLPRMPVVDKARAAGKSPKYNERMQDLLDSPTARKKVDSLINKGKELNMKEWYGTEPLRQVAMDAGRTPEQFESLMAQLASASQRNPVDKQNQMGSYLYHLSETGQLPENALLLTNKLKKELKADPSLAEGRTLIELPKGYGSLAQGDIFNRAVQIGQGDIAGALPPNKKLGTFYENLLGNLQPVTVDVNAVRGPIIERGDPRWLTSKLVEKDETGKVINSYKPREMLESGEMTLREAKQRPGFWEAAPSGSEYAGFEDLWQRGAKRHDVAPAEAQALGWYGSADVTALKTKPENYVDNLERLIKRTAEQTGKSPSEVMNDLVTGQGFLRKDGGAVERKETPEEMARFHKRFALHKATGGKVNIPHLSLKTPKRMADGGSSSEPTAREIAEQLGKLAAQQGKEEVESYKKPRAATDIGNRGILAPALGAPVDLMNMGLMGIDSVSQAIGKPTRLASEKPFGGSEHLKDLMDKYGVTSGEDRPMTETALSLFSPTGMIKGAMGVTKGAMKAADAMRKPVSGLGAMRAKAN